MAISWGIRIEALSSTAFGLSGSLLEGQFLPLDLCRASAGRRLRDRSGKSRKLLPRLSSWLFA